LQWSVPMTARPIRIVLVAENLYGGTGVHTSALADHLVGVDAHVVLIASPIPPWPESGSDRVPSNALVTLVGPLRVSDQRARQRGMRDAARHADPDVIYFGKGGPFDGSLRLEAQLGRIAPLVVFEHDAPPQEDERAPFRWAGWRPALGLHWRVPRMLYGLRHRIATRVLSNSLSTAAKQRTHYGGSVDEVIPLGVDLERFHPDADAAAAEGRPLHIGLVGRPDVPMKGLDLAFAAIAAVAGRGGAPVRVTFPVPLDQQRRILELLDVHGAASHVRLVPPISPDDLPRFYSSLNALLVASRFEGGPYTMLEAMACGTPVIATPVGLVPEVIEDGINGIRVATTDSVPDLVRAIERFAELSDDARRAMGEQARARIVERHDAEHHFARLRAILHEVARR
jgi:glycosyltransferase involved in cell wall biosynthesis